jgi:hypothetical protein
MEKWGAETTSRRTAAATRPAQQFAQNQCPHDSAYELGGGGKSSKQTSHIAPSPAAMKTTQSWNSRSRTLVTELHVPANSGAASLSDAMPAALNKAVASFRISFSSNCDRRAQSGEPHQQPRKRTKPTVYLSVPFTVTQQHARV